MHAMLIQAAADAADPHLTFTSVLQDIPHDPAAVAVYIMSAIAVGWVVIAGRRKGGGGGSQHQPGA